MEGTHVLDLDIRGESVPVYVNRRGCFKAEFHGNEVGYGYGEESLAQLRDKLLLASRKRAVKLAIPVMRVLSTSFEPLTLTGVHGGTGNTMALRSNGKSDQLTGENSNTFTCVLTAEEQAKYLALRDAFYEAQTAFSTYRRKVEISPRRLVEEETARQAAQVTEGAK